MQRLSGVSDMSMPLLDRAMPLGFEASWVGDEYDWEGRYPSVTLSVFVWTSEYC
ncbi:hypothetical protein GALMADRAFT_259545 [Galerina marginata CBS 339.88]|uniref:Uncharacterized protein n=1 Tax=Galerina marginata (strain CBS 339.88) TaxID=685588 RepID=A0A067S5Y2_GALM3|nr:hypothetical protein GALMADRAFT_259545 [Galerina marginata CBS 339.88]